MCTLITMVGKQPGAVATTAKTLLKHKGLSSAVLFYTKDTSEESQRLMYFMDDLAKSERTRISVQGRLIATDPQGANSEKLPWNIIKELFEAKNHPEPIYFDTSPGLNYLIALISLHLSNEALVTPLYADYSHLYLLENPQQNWELEHIGLDNLLALHNLSTDPPINPGETFKIGFTVKRYPRFVYLLPKNVTGNCMG